MPGTTSAQQFLSAAPVAPDQDLPEGYWEIVTRYRADLVSQALAIVGRLEDAEDVVQETFVEAFRNQEKLAQARSLGAWLRAINRANALNRLATRKRQDRDGQDAPERRAVTTGGFSVLELRESIARAVETLPAGHRAVVVMRFWEHLPFHEIARRLGQPEGTVRWLACDALVKLHGKLGTFFPGAGPGAARPEGGAEGAAR